MKSFGIVFGYSFKERVRSKSFLLMTLVLVALIAAIVFIPKLTGGQASTRGTVAVLNTTALPVDVEGLETSVSPFYTWTLIPENELGAQNKRLQNKEVAAVVTLAPVAEAAPQITLSVNRQDDVSFAPDLSAYVERLNVNERVASLGLSPGQAASIVARPSLETNELNAGGKSTAETFMPVYALLGVMFFMIYLFAGNVATSVAIEKGSRIQEILITKVSPGHLLAGKVLGVGLAGILQFAIIFGFGALLITFGGASETLTFGAVSIDLSILGGQTLAVAASVFVLGYFFYATLFAAAGSMVSRSEELNQAMLPISMLLMAAFIIAIVGLSDPDGTLAVVSSYIPFFTPMALLTRVGAGDPTLLEIGLPLLILAVSTLLVGGLSAKIYRNGVLLYGQKPSLGMMLKMLGTPNKTLRPQGKPVSGKAKDAV